MEINKKLFQDRKRTNILNGPEQKLISYLVPRIPAWISSDGLTVIGFVGSLMILGSFILAAHVHVCYLLLSVVGFFVQWFGDSLDGRIAYYRNKSRKWYGFALDIVMDWVSTVMIGLGFLLYVDSQYEILGFVLVSLYGWAMIISQLRYKITGKYTIDAGFVGPTEIRVILSAVIVLEIFVSGSILYSVFVICIILFFINIVDTKNLLALGDERDKQEKQEKASADQ